MAAVFDDEAPPGETPAQSDSQAVAEAAAPSTADAEPPYEQRPLTIKENEVEFVKGSIEEATEHVESVEAAVLEVERAPGDAEKINDLFRPCHAIKGMAGFLNLRDVNCLTHEVETLLDQGRKSHRKITPGLLDLILDVVDILKVQITAIAAYPDSDAVAQPPVAEVIGHLRAVVAGRIEPSAREAGPGSGAQRIGENLVEQGAVPQEVVDFALESQKSGQTEKKTGEILRENKTARAKQISQSVRPQAQAVGG